MNIVRRMCQEGLSVLLIEQNAPLSLSIADRAYVLDDGKVVYSGDAVDLAKDTELVKKLRVRAATPRRPHSRFLHRRGGQRTGLRDFEVPGAVFTPMASSFETHRCAMLLRIRSQTVMVRSAPSRVSSPRPPENLDNDSSEPENALACTFDTVVQSADP